jgi:hypothetical protein
MNVRFSQLTLGPIGWVLVVGAGLVLGVGLARVGVFLLLALILGVGGVLGTLLFLDRRTAKRIARGRVATRRRSLKRR